MKLSALHPNYNFFHADEARAAMVKATRGFTAALGDRTAEGYVFRTDLRLRPDPGATPVAIVGASPDGTARTASATNNHKRLRFLKN